MRRTDDDVGIAVAVHVAGGADDVAEATVGLRAEDREIGALRPLPAVGHPRRMEHERGADAVRRPGRGLRESRRRPVVVVPRGTDHHVRQAVAVHVPGRCHRGAEPRAVLRAHDRPVGAHRCPSASHGSECRPAAEQVGGARLLLVARDPFDRLIELGPLALSSLDYFWALEQHGVVVGSPDDQIGVAVAVDVAGGGDRVAEARRVGRVGRVGDAQTSLLAVDPPGCLPAGRETAPGGPVVDEGRAEGLT